MYCPDMLSQPLAVVAPAVPALLQILVPLILVTGFALVTAVPRGILMFAHWLWSRAAPRALRTRSVAGVKSRTFQGVASRGFEDEYVFSVPDAIEDIDGRIIGFYKRHGARLQGDAGRLTFLRGNRFWTYFLSHIVPCRERDLLQRITVGSVKKLKGEIEIRVRYTVQTFCMLRLQPAGLQSEIRALSEGLRSRTPA